MDNEAPRHAYIHVHTRPGGDHSTELHKGGCALLHLNTLASRRRRSTLSHRALGQGRSLRIDLRVTTQRARGGGSGGGAEVGAVAVCLKTGITVTVL